MMYKTIVLELLRERTALHEELRLARQLLPTLETLSQELRASHQTWMQTLKAANPGSDPVQIESEAMELATRELEDRLPSVLPADEAEPLLLDQAMAFVRKHTPGD